MERAFLTGYAAGGKHWKMKYRQANGKESLLSFGAYPAVTLERARKMRDEPAPKKRRDSTPVKSDDRKKRNGNL